MELTPLRYFSAIVKHGHMTRAARALGVTQPALSAMLKKLEREVGAELLHRTGRGVAPTEAGRVFLQYADDALRRAEAGVKAVRELVGLERGSIRIGGGATATTYLLPRVVSAVRTKHPGLRFYVREAGSNAVAAAVRSGELDLGLVTLPLRDIDVDELLAIPLVDDELRLIIPLPPGHEEAQVEQAVSLAGKAPKRMDRPVVEAAAGRSPHSDPMWFVWKELADVPVVAFEAGTAVREMVDQASAKAGVTLNVVMELRSIESIKRMVAARIGVAFVSRFALAPEEGAVCRDAPLKRTLAIIRRRDRVPSAAVQEFERVLRATVGK